MELCVSGDCVDCVLDNVVLLILRELSIEIVRVDCRHEDDSVVVDWVLGKVRIVPHFDLALLIEPNEVLMNLEGPHSSEELRESSQGLAQNVHSLTMIKPLNPAQPVRNVLSENRDRGWVLAHASALFRKLSVESVDYRLAG